jgi:CBS-domain-containing membrane protein
MLTTTRPLMAMTAANLMSRELVMIPEDMSLRDAAGILSRSQISGAPVIDHEGRCVGIVTTTDFLRWFNKGTTATLAFGPLSRAEPDLETLDVEVLPTDEVRANMTTDLVTVGAEEPVGWLARLMIDAHIHHVVVIDEVGRPVGIVTSTDILAAVARPYPQA